MEKSLDYIRLTHDAEIFFSFPSELVTQKHHCLDNGQYYKPVSLTDHNSPQCTRDDTGIFQTLPHTPPWTHSGHTHRLKVKGHNHQ